MHYLHWGWNLANNKCSGAGEPVNDAGNLFSSEICYYYKGHFSANFTQNAKTTVLIIFKFVTFNTIRYDTINLLVNTVLQLQCIEILVPANIVQIQKFNGFNNKSVFKSGGSHTR